MTRFARAKGSKSSNEKAPEDSTPWEVMKEQLLDSKKQNQDFKKRQEAENQRVANYENFLKDHKTQKKKATWCDFPVDNINQIPNRSEVPPSKKKKNKNKNRDESKQCDVISVNTNTLGPETVKNKKNKKEAAHIESIKNANTFVETVSSDSKMLSKTKEKNKKKKKNDKPPTDSNNTSVSLHVKPDLADENQNNNNADTNNSKKSQKKKKNKNGKPTRRKPVDDNSFQFIINGKEVDLVRYDGFPIMRKDADRLDDLKKNMIKKGIPKSEVQRTMKLERRRAEKALARLKRDVCYNCRKGGHNLSDCPELKSKVPGVDAADGVCFKCGSTEHMQFECKVQKDQGFRFATCFICKEQGHIARQCPDNPKGLYPNGGACKLCGDVTHLRKDCPTVQNKREDSSIKLQTLDNVDSIEDIDQQKGNPPVTMKSDTPKKPKKIKF